MPESYSFSPQFATIRSASPLEGMRPVKAVHTALQFQPQKFLEVKSEQPELVSNAWASGLKEGIGDALKGITAAFVDERKAKRQEKKENLDRFARIIVAQARGSKGAEEDKQKEEYKNAQLENLKLQIEERKKKAQEEGGDGGFVEGDEINASDMDAYDVSEDEMPSAMWDLGLPEETEDVLNPLTSVGPTEQDARALWSRPLSELTAEASPQKQYDQLTSTSLAPVSPVMSTDVVAGKAPVQARPSLDINTRSMSLMTPQVRSAMAEQFYAETGEMPLGMGALAKVPLPEREKQQIKQAPQQSVETEIANLVNDYANAGTALKAQKRIAERLGPEYHEAKIERVTKKGKTGFRVNFPEKKTIDQLKKEKEALNPQPGMSKDQIGVYDKLYANVQQNPLIKNAIDAKSSSDIILSSLAEENGFGDINAINAFQRMVDPGVAVREGDVSLLQSAMPRLRRMGLTVANLIEGDKLTPEARDQLKILAKKIANTRISSAKQPISDLRQIAIDSGINPDRVIRELTIEVEPQENLQNLTKQKFMQMKEMPEGEEKEQLKKELKVLVEQLRATQKK